MATTSKTSADPTLPSSLRTAMALLGVESLGILAIGGWLLFGTLTEGGQGLAIGLSSALFVIACGLGVGLASYGVLRLRGWARGPATLAQFLVLPLGWQLLSEPTTPAGMTAIALAIAVLVSLFLPSSTQAFQQAVPAKGEGSVF